MLLTSRYGEPLNSKPQLNETNAPLGSWKVLVSCVVIIICQRGRGKNVFCCFKPDLASASFPSKAINGQYITWLDAALQYSAVAGTRFSNLLDTHSLIWVNRDRCFAICQVVPFAFQSTGRRSHLCRLCALKRLPEQSFNQIPQIDVWILTSHDCSQR